MTFQPPPPPPPATPPPGGGYQPPPSAFDPKTVDNLDWGILGAGLLAFIFSFVDYYTFSYGPISVSENAWHGFFGWFAMLLAIVGSGAVAMSIFAPHVKLPMANRLLGLGAYAIATLCVLLALFIVPGYLGVDVGSGVSKGHGFGYWASLVVIVAGLVLSLMRFQQTGGQLPGALANIPNIGGHSSAPQAPSAPMPQQQMPPPMPQQQMPPPMPPMPPQAPPMPPQQMPPPPMPPQAPPPPPGPPPAP